MKTTLSSRVAVNFPLQELVAAAARRGLAGVELAEGDGHDVTVQMAGPRVRALAAEAEREGGPVRGFAAESPEAAFDPAYARLSAALGAPVVAPWTRCGAGCGGSCAADVASAAACYRAEGGLLLLEVGSEPGRAADLCEAIRAAGPGTIGLAWSVAPTDAELGDVGQAMLAAAGPLLRRIRLAGGGPEAAAHEGRGIGTLMARLALAAWDGDLVLAPSEPAARHLWRLWLGRSRGWGCGSKASDPSMVSLGDAPAGV